MPDWLEEADIARIQQMFASGELSAEELVYLPALQLIAKRLRSIKQGADVVFTDKTVVRLERKKPAP